MERHDDGVKVETARGLAGSEPSERRPFEEGQDDAARVPVSTERDLHHAAEIWVRDPRPFVGAIRGGLD